MRTVHRGDTYLLRGMVTGGNVSLEGASESRRPIFASKGAGERSGGEADVFDNHLYYDNEGHFTTVYYLGDRESDWPGGMGLATRFSFFVERFVNFGRFKKFED